MCVCISWVSVYTIHLSNPLQDRGCFPIETHVDSLCLIYNRATYCGFTHSLHCTHDTYGLCSRLHWKLNGIFAISWFWFLCILFFNSLRALCMFLYAFVSFPIMQYYARMKLHITFVNIKVPTHWKHIWELLSYELMEKEKDELIILYLYLWFGRNE